jgi:hypothetical protein
MISKKMHREKCAFTTVVFLQISKSLEEKAQKSQRNDQGFQELSAFRTVYGSLLVWAKH